MVRESSILAPNGRPIVVMEPAYRTAGTGRRFVGLVAPTRLGPNAALLPDLDVLRARSRALYRNNAVIWGAIEKLVANLVGWGITPKSLYMSPFVDHPDQAGFDKQNEADAAVRKQIDETWADWAKQVKLDALQKRAVRECMLAGEVFLRIRPRFPQDTDALGRKLLVPLELQLIEAEHCPTWEDRPLENGHYIRGGIEFDQIGRRTAYWMYPQHPGDGAMFAGPLANSLVPVPASEVIHLYDPDSPEAIRGTPRLSRTLLTAHDLDAFNDATLQRQAIASLFAGFIKRIEGATDPGFLGETAATPEPTLEPGTLSYLADGEDIVFPNPPDVGNNYGAFVKEMHLLLSVGTGLTYEQVSNDLSSVNYSSIRAGSLEFRRGCQMWQYTTFVPEFLEPIWVKFLRRAQLAGALSVPDLDRNELVAGRVEWLAQGWDWVDPEKEVNAAIKAVQAGFETRRSVNIARGNDPVRLENERKAEVQRAEQLGLQFSTDVAAPPSASATEMATPATPAQPGKRSA